MAEKHEETEASEKSNTAPSLTPLSPERWKRGGGEGQEEES
jgi:hypothetical protein